MARKIESIVAARTLAALGHPTRFALVKRLSKAETFAGMSIVELTEGSGLTSQAITKHLEALADVGLVHRQKIGRAAWFELNTAPVNSAVEMLAELTKQRADSKKRFKSESEKLFEKSL